MIALALTLVTCSPLGAAVADRAEDALAKPATAKRWSDAEATKQLGTLAARATKFAARTVDREHYRASTAAALDEFAALVEAYLAVLPRLPPAQVLVAIEALVNLTNAIEAIVDIGPPDWPDDTWADYRDALGCQSHGRELIELGLRYAYEQDVKSPVRARLEAARQRKAWDVVDY